MGIIAQLMDIGARVAIRCSRSPADLMHVAESELREAGDRGGLDLDELATVGVRAAPQFQTDPSDHYASGSITVWADANVAADIYIHNLTFSGVHSHGFVGAFRVLYGEMVEARYLCRAAHPLHDVLLADLDVGSTAVLGAGEIRPISDDLGLIHALVGIADYSVTCVIRSRRATSSMYLFRSGLGIDYSRARSLVLRKAARILAAVARENRGEAARVLPALLANCSSMSERCQIIGDLLFAVSDVESRSCKLEPELFATAVGDERLVSGILAAHEARVATARAMIELRRTEGRDARLKAALGMMAAVQ